MGIFPTKSDPKISLSEALDPQPKPIPEPAPAPEPEPVAEPEPEPATVAEVVDVDSELKQHAKAIRAASRTAVASLLKAGEHLAQARRLLADHAGGTFARWVKDDCGLGKSTAYRMIAVWEAFGSRPGAGTTLGGVPTWALQQLASSPEAIAQVADLVEAGERLTEADARKILTATRSATGEVEQAEPGTVKKPDPITFLTDDGAIIVRLARHDVNVAQFVARLAKKLLAEDQARRTAA